MNCRCLSLIADRVENALAILQSAGLGGDLKLGIGSNLTLDATVNPDFGQVEADPAVVNLTAFETFFPERRPFFLERSQLLRGGHRKNDGVAAHAVQRHLALGGDVAAGALQQLLLLAAGLGQQVGVHALALRAALGEGLLHPFELPVQRRVDADDRREIRVEDHHVGLHVPAHRVAAPLHEVEHHGVAGQPVVLVQVVEVGVRPRDFKAHH